MERLLPRCLLFLLFLGCAAGESGSDTCRLGPYGTPLLDDPMQCSDASGESSLHRAETSLTNPRKASAGDPPAKETGGPWTALLSCFSAGERSQPSQKGSEGAGAVEVQGEQCHKWIQGQATPVETFRCPIELHHPADIFCCGTCVASYCCSSPKDRLEQASCSRVMEETEDQGAEESALTWPEDPSTVKSIGLLLIIIGAIWIAFVVIHFRENMEMIMLDDEPPEMVFELRAPVPVDPPMPGLPAASGNPDPACLVPEESQRSSKLPLAVADSASGSGSPMDWETTSPAVLLEGNLEAPSEAEETAL